MADWHVKVQTPYGTDNPFLVEDASDRPFLNGHQPDKDYFHGGSLGPSAAGKVSLQLFTDNHAYWRRIEVYEIAYIHLDHQGEAGPPGFPGVAWPHLPDEIHVGGLVAATEAENGSTGAQINFDAHNKVLIFHKAKEFGVHHLMYVARADRIGLTPPGPPLAWRVWWSDL